MSLRHLNLMSYSYYLGFLTNCVIGAILLTLDIGVDEYYLINVIPRESSTLFVVGALSWAMIGVPLGSLIVAAWVHMRPRRALQEFYARSIPVAHHAEKHALLIVITLTVLSSAATIATALRLGTIPIASAFFMSPLEKAAFRGNVKFEYAGNAILRNILTKMLPMIVSYASMVWARCSKRWRWRLILGVNIMLASIGATWTLEKAPLVNYLIGFMFVDLAMGNTSLKMVGSYACGSILLFLLAFAMIGGTQGLGALFILVTHRLLLSQIAPLYFYPRVFPEYHPYIMGTSYPGFVAKLSGVEAVRASRIVMSYRNPVGVELNVAGHMNTLFVGEAYANWGLCGVVFSPIIAGIMIGIVYYVLITRRKTPGWIAAYSFICVDVAFTLTGGFIDFLYNPGWMIVFAGVFVAELLVYNKRRGHP